MRCSSVVDPLSSMFKALGLFPQHTYVWGERGRRERGREKGKEREVPIRSTIENGSVWSVLFYSIPSSLLTLLRGPT